MEMGENSVLKTAVILLSAESGLWPCKKGMTKLWLNAAFASGLEDTVRDKSVPIFIFPPSSANTILTKVALEKERSEKKRIALKEFT
jgi:hypothetical protein